MRMKTALLFAVFLLFCVVLPGRALAESSSSDANGCLLQSLIVKNGTMAPGFSSQTNTYNVVVENQVKSLQIEATAKDPSAAVTIAGADKLVTGRQNQVTVTVAANGTSFVYTLFVFRKSGFSAPLNDSCLLASLQLNGGKIPVSFSADQSSYEVTLPTDIKTISVDASPQNNNNVVKVYGGNEIIDSNVHILNISVTDPSGDSSIYTLYLSRKAPQTGGIFLVVICAASAAAGIIGTLLFLLSKTDPAKKN